MATGNVHAHARARAPLQDAFVAVRLHSTLDASEPERRGNFSHVLASPAAMAARFAEHPEAVAETARVAGRLTFDLGSDLGYRYPGAEDGSALRELGELCETRLHDRYPGVAADVRERARGRLEEELRIIEKLGPGRLLPAASRSCWSWRARWPLEVRGPETRRGRCCRPGGGAARACPRSSAT